MRIKAESIFAVLIFSALALAIYSFYSLEIIKNTNIGVYDFFYYYIPFQVLKAGLNPYSTENLAIEFLKYKDSIHHQPLIFLYPPHLLILLAPILVLPFSLSPTIWLLTNIVLLAVTSIIAVKVCTKVLEIKIENRQILLLAFLTSIFPPAFESISWGQCNMLITFGITAMILAIITNRSHLFGLLALCSTLKPHLVLGIFAFIFLHLIRKRKFNFIRNTVYWFLSVFFIAQIYHPGIWINWIKNFKQASNHGLSMRNAVFADQIQYLLLKTTSTLSSWPEVILPILGIIICAILANKDFKHSIPRMLFASYFLAPYGWYYDQSILILIYAFSLCLALKTKVNLRTLLFSTAPIIMVSIFDFLYGNAQHHYFWFPIVIWLHFEVTIVLVRNSNKILA